MAILRLPDELLYGIATDAANIDIFAVAKSFSKHRDSVLTNLLRDISTVSDLDTVRILCLMSKNTNSVLNIHPTVRVDATIADLMLQRSNGMDYINFDASLKELLFQNALVHSSGYIFRHLPTRFQTLPEAINFAAKLIGIDSEEDLTSHELASTIHDVLEYSSPQIEL